ncbi:MAG: DUF3301 domain-containing protein [Zoogloeaceae bacterium]|nr:DUF3301 domain-containing protein [Zoogloeaceae bacterium]
MNGLEVVVLLVLALGGWYWMDSLSALELVRRLAQEACARDGVQLLDDTVVIERTRPTRDDDGRLSLARDCRFEFSVEGTDRQVGRLRLIARELVWLELTSRPRFHVINGGR